MRIITLALGGRVVQDGRLTLVYKEFVEGSGVVLSVKHSPYVDAEDVLFTVDGQHAPQMFSYGRYGVQVSYADAGSATVIITG